MILSSILYTTHFNDTFQNMPIWPHVVLAFYVSIPPNATSRPYPFVKLMKAVQFDFGGPYIVAYG